MNYKNIGLVIFASLLLGGCVAQWKAVNSQNRIIAQSGTQVELPLGWVSIEVNKKLAVVSNDGPSLNAVAIETLALADIQKELKSGVDANMDMLEASKKYLAFWSKRNNIADFDIVKEDFVEIDGRGHYVVEWTFKDENGTTVRNIAQGTVKNNSIVNIAYSAPNIHYFARHKDQVNAIFASVKYI